MQNESLISFAVNISSLSIVEVNILKTVLNSLFYYFCRVAGLKCFQKDAQSILISIIHRPRHGPNLSYCTAACAQYLTAGFFWFIGLGQTAVNDAFFILVHQLRKNLRYTKAESVYRHFNIIFCLHLFGCKHDFQIFNGMGDNPVPVVHTN